MTAMQLALAVAFLLLSAASDQASAQTCKEMRKINVGVSVAPPNVVHTSPYIAKALGLFAARCIDATIIQFDGGATGTAVTAVAQGRAVTTLPDVAIAQGLKGKQIWALAPRAPQAYVVAENVKTAADLKGRKLSAAGGVGGFNWLIGREVLKTAGLTVDDAQFISQGTAGRLPGLVVGQIDGVLLHPEDVYIAQKQKPGVHVLVLLADLLPQLMFNAYGASDDYIAHNGELLRDTFAALIEANRTIYRDRDAVVPIMVEATQKPREAVDYAWEVMTRNCIWSVNQGFRPERSAWNIDNAIRNGDLDASKRIGFAQIVDARLADEALAAAGGPTTIHGCKD